MGKLSPTSPELVSQVFVYVIWFFAQINVTDTEGRTRTPVLHQAYHRFTVAGLKMNSEVASYWVV